MTEHRKIPELHAGIRVQYIDKDEATRTERIHSRSGNTITVINALKEKNRITIGQIIGYWEPKVKASPKNMIRIEGAQ